MLLTIPMPFSFTFIKCCGFFYKCKLIIFKPMLFFSSLLLAVWWGCVLVGIFRQFLAILANISERIIVAYTVVLFDPLKGGLDLWHLQIPLIIQVSFFYQIKVYFLVKRRHALFSLASLNGFDNMQRSATKFYNRWVFNVDILILLQNT